MRAGESICRKLESGRLKPLVWTIWALAFCNSGTWLPAQQGLPNVFLSRSVSGQFVVQSSPTVSASVLATYLENDTNFIRLDPTLLPVSCERIKQVLWRELGLAPPWAGKVFLRLYPASSDEDPITIDSEQFRDGWQYRVSLPAIANRQRYVRAIVTVLLMEAANRRAAEHSAEVPAWLREGLGREIWAADEREVILPPPQISSAGFRMTTMLVNARKQNPLEQAHRELCAATPLNFQQLSWPATDEQAGEPGEIYRSCAQVFVHQLLLLPNGQAAMRQMLQELPRFYNWQFAFFDTFHDTFQKPLDVEKWWSLQLVHFTGRELADSWSADDSWQKLDELVRSAVQVRVGTNDLPLHTEVTLQTIIRDWPVARQTPALQTKLSELQMLRLRLARELAEVADQYCRVIESYLAALNHHGFILPFRKHAVQLRNEEETLQQLDWLDGRRAALRPKAPPEQPMQADSRRMPIP